MNYFSEKDFIKILSSVWTHELPFPRVVGKKVQSGREIEFAKSSIHLGSFRKVAACRKLTRGTEKSWISTNVYVKKFDFFKKTEYTFDRGEDPRLFIFKNQPHVMVQAFNENQRDIDISITNLKNGVEYCLNAPFGFNGKNWVPFEQNGEQYFLYSLSPLVVLKLNSSKNKVRLEAINRVENFRPKWEHDLEESIGVFRGGSPALPVSEGLLFGFTHAINPAGDIHAHRLGYFSLKFPQLILNHIYLTDYLAGFLIDPYGLQIKKNKVLVDGTMAMGDIHETDSFIYNFRMIFDLSQLKSYLCGRKGEDE